MRIASCRYEQKGNQSNHENCEASQVDETTRREDIPALVVLAVASWVRVVNVVVIFWGIWVEVGAPL